MMTPTTQPWVSTKKMSAYTFMAIDYRKGFSRDFPFELMFMIQIELFRYFSRLSPRPLAFQVVFQQLFFNTQSGFFIQVSVLNGP